MLKNNPVRAFSKCTEKAAASNHRVVLQRVLASSFAPNKPDFLCALSLQPAGRGSSAHSRRLMKGWKRWDVCERYTFITVQFDFCSTFYNKTASRCFAEAANVFYIIWVSMSPW